MVEKNTPQQTELHEARLLLKAYDDSERTTSPLAVDRSNYGETLAVLRNQQQAKFIPAVFRPDDLQVGPPHLEQVQQRTQPGESLRKSDVDDVLRDVVGGGGWSDAGKAAWKNMFNSIAADPIDEHQAGEKLRYVAGAFRNVDMYRITDSKGNTHYYAGIVHGQDDTARQDHLKWLEAAQKAAQRGEPIPEIPRALTTLTEVGEKALPKELAPLVADARKGVLSKAGAQALQDIFKKGNDPKADDLDLMESLNDVKERINSMTAANRLDITKTTTADATEHYFATIGGKKIEIGTRPLPNEYKPILEAARGKGVPNNKPLTWSPAAEQAWQKAYEHLSNLPGATSESIGNSLNELGARMNNVIGQNRVGMLIAGDGDAGGWIMSLGRTNADRIGALFGTNPDAGVKLGPFRPKQAPSYPPGRDL